MASKEAPSFDDLEPVANDFDDDDAEQIQLEPGDSVVGEIRQIHTGLGEYDSTLLYIARGLGDPHGLQLAFLVTVVSWGVTV